MIRKTLLYKTGVEYGDYTINHVLGCSHGCIYPCYAFMMARRFGRIKDYNDWLKPRLVENALDLLKKEIPRKQKSIKSVHLCFTTDPFMSGYPEVTKMSLEIIKLLDHYGIKCTALTKGLLPSELSRFDRKHEWGISLVSFDENFRKQYEPFSADYPTRLASIKNLHDLGCRTWVSIEPYPTPNIVKQDLVSLLDKVSFTDRIIFGRLHYNKLVSTYPDYQNFYNDAVKTVIDFCNEFDIAYHIKAGTLKDNVLTRNHSKEVIMKPFVPDELPLANINWVSHVNSIGKAQAALARYDGMLQGIVNPSLLLTPLTTQEAVLSSRIEGTLATMEEVLEFDAEPNERLAPGKQADIQEIINYRNAISYAIAELEKRPLSLNMIKEIHAILLDSVRGRNKARGEFRRIQNYIGPPDAKIEDASYIPPPPDMVMPTLSNWEEYIHSDEKDALVQLAIVKGQFEIIHPFLDGNGRIGRILIPLFLYEKKLLSSPMFYLSSYLENNRDAYYDSLKSISEKGDWDGWISFFLNGITEQANENIIKVKAIKELYDRIKLEIPSITHSQYSIKATDALFVSPIITTASFIKLSSIPKDSAVRILNTLREYKILHDIRKPRGRRSGLFSFSELWSIVK